jgi:hypothetical protein
MTGNDRKKLQVLGENVVVIFPRKNSFLCVKTAEVKIIT